MQHADEAKVLNEVVHVFFQIVFLLFDLVACNFVCLRSNSHGDDTRNNRKRNYESVALFAEPWSAARWKFLATKWSSGNGSRNNGPCTNRNVC